MLLTQSTVRSDVVDIPRLRLAHGGELRAVRIAYQACGSDDQPAVVVLGGISAGRQIAPGWWQDFVGAEKPIDTDRFRVIGIDFLGGCGASTRADTETFPAVSSIDQATAVCAVLDTLGITRLACFIGSSYGGMVALAFAEHFPARVARVVAISAAHEPHPMATALRSLQRRTIRLGLQSGHVDEAVAIARGIAMTTYRTSTEFAQRFDVAAAYDGAAWRHPVEDYIEQRGREFAGRFAAAAFLCLSQSGDLHHVDPSRIRVPVTLVAVDGDTLVPSWQMHELADRLAGDVDLHTISSIYGHDAFLKEVGAISSILRSTLSQEVEL
jgi:homoserine O-acetyltransferase/O-succinyltransferase